MSGRPSRSTAPMASMSISTTSAGPPRKPPPPPWRGAPAPLARGALIVLCGAISQYNVTGPPKGPSNYMALLVHRASMKGFLAGDYAARDDEATQALAGWRTSGTLRSREHIVEGLETFPDTLIKLFTGDHLGKLIIKVADE